MHTTPIRSISLWLPCEFQSELLTPLNHPSVRLFPGVCACFYAIWGKSKAVLCGWLSLKIWGPEERKDSTDYRSQGCACPHFSQASSLPQLPQKVMSSTLLSPPESSLFLFLSFTHPEPPNSYLFIH